MTPPYVLGTPKPESSVIISRMFGACLGGTIRGAHHALDCMALSLITPPNFGSGAGSCLPLMVVVAPGEPGVPVVWICCAWRELAAATRMQNWVLPRTSLSVFMNVKLACFCSSKRAICRESHDLPMGL